VSDLKLEENVWMLKTAVEVSRDISEEFSFEYKGVYLQDSGEFSFAFDDGIGYLTFSTDMPNRESLSDANDEEVTGILSGLRGTEDLEFVVDEPDAEGWAAREELIASKLKAFDSRFLEKATQEYGGDRARQLRHYYMPSCKDLDL